jgi:hypothetical protein
MTTDLNTRDGSTVVEQDTRLNFFSYQKFIVALLAFLRFSIILDFMIISPLGAIIMPDPHRCTLSFTVQTKLRVRLNTRSHVRQRPGVPQDYVLALVWLIWRLPAAIQRGGNSGYRRREADPGTDRGSAKA